MHTKRRCCVLSDYGFHMLLSIQIKMGDIAQDAASQMSYDFKKRGVLLVMET